MNTLLACLLAFVNPIVEMEVRVRPFENDARQCEVVLSCRGLESSPVRLANSIWQGVKIGVAAEAVDSSPRNWIDLEAFLFASFVSNP